MIDFHSRIKPSVEFALCLILYHLSFPTTLAWMAYEFGKSPTFVSLVVNDTLKHLECQYWPLLEWNPLIDYDQIAAFASHLSEHCSGDFIWGFIDGMFKPFCRPTEGQCLHYSSYKKSHGLKFQVITTPDGMISHLSGPWLGPDNDLTIA